jgi:hypothetical protein
MKTHPEHVYRRLEQRGIYLNALDHQGRSLVTGDQVPPAIEGDPRIGLVRSEDAVESDADGSEHRIVERSLWKSGRVPGGKQDLVPLPERDLELLRDT